MKSTKNAVAKARKNKPMVRFEFMGRMTGLFRQYCPICFRKPAHSRSPWFNISNRLFRRFESKYNQCELKKHLAWGVF